MADICKFLRKQRSNEMEWTWNATYQKIFDKAKSIIKDQACRKFYDETKPLHIEKDASEVGLGSTLLQTRSNTSCPKEEAPDNSILRPIAFTTEILTGIEKRYSNTERGALGILYRQKISTLLLCERGEYNYRLQTTSCNIEKGSGNIITENTMNSPKIHQHRVEIIYKPGLD